MTFYYNDEEYNVIIDKKKSNKNTYIRVKNDLNIYVTTNYFTTDRSIKKLIDDNYKSIIRMINQEKKKLENSTGFNYLGKKYDIEYVDYTDMAIEDDKVFLNKKYDIDKWYKERAKYVFKERLDLIYNNFSRDIPYPDLRIRKMTTRWGVCNTRSKTITLNLELIKRDIKYLDYVIVHELSHLIYGDHSNSFWSLVEENYSDYKKIRKEMKDF